MLYIVHLNDKNNQFYYLIKQFTSLKIFNGTKQLKNINIISLVMNSKKFMMNHSSKG